MGNHNQLKLKRYDCRILRKNDFKILTQNLDILTLKQENLVKSAFLIGFKRVIWQNLSIFSQECESGFNFSHTLT